MRIGIDARVLERRMTGIGRYLNGILTGIKKFDSENEYYLFSYNKLSNADEFFTNIVTTSEKKYSKLYSYYWLKNILPKFLELNQIELFFSPNNFLPSKKLDIACIATIHDTVHKIDKKFHPFSYRMYKDLILPSSIRKSNLILTVSENSKDDLVKYYNVDRNKIRVVYQYIDDKFSKRELSKSESQKILRKYGISENPILYMGAIENRKNITGILKIADLLKEKTPNDIILVGKQGYGFEELYGQIKNRNNVKHIEYVEENDIQYLFNISKIFLFPSFYEGFGLPPLEAMKSGVPTITSNTSALKEVVEDGAITLAPTDYQGFAEQIQKLLNDSEYYEKMENKGLKIAKKYNLENTTKNVIDIFNEFNQ